MGRGRKARREREREREREVVNKCWFSSLDFKHRCASALVALTDSRRFIRNTPRRDRLGGPKERYPI